MGVTCLGPQKDSQEESLAASMELCCAERESGLFLTQHSLAALHTLDSTHWVRLPPPLRLLLTLWWDHSCSAHSLSFLGSEARVVSECGPPVSGLFTGGSKCRAQGCQFQQEQTIKLQTLPRTKSTHPEPSACPSALRSLECAEQDLHRRAARQSQHRCRRTGEPIGSHREGLAFQCGHGVGGMLRSTGGPSAAQPHWVKRRDV